jgi:diaminopimelate decarboxylase
MHATDHLGFTAGTPSWRSFHSPPPLHSEDEAAHTALMPSAAVTCAHWRQSTVPPSTVSTRPPSTQRRRPIGPRWRTIYPGEGAITYAGKAYLSRAMAQWTQRHGLWVDCTGAGEIGIAAAAGVPRERILVHGVNKSDADLDAAVAHAATIVVDNLSELHRLTPRLLAATNPPSLWLRVRPGVAVDTHAYRQTGQEDSKFGMAPLEIMAAVRHCLQHGLALSGLHFHQGSHFHDPAPIGPALEIVLDLTAEIASTTGWQHALTVAGRGLGRRLSRG